MGENPIRSSPDPEPPNFRSLEDFLKSICEFGIKLETSGLGQIPEVVKFRESIKELISDILELKVDVSLDNLNLIVKSINDGCKIEDLKTAFENRRKKVPWRKKKVA